MKSYLDTIAESIAERFGAKPDECIIIAPSAISGKLIQQGMAAKMKRAFWSPKVLNMQGLCEYFSGDKVAAQPDLLVLLYDAYTSCMNDVQPFSEFRSWGESLLRDFQEIQLSQVDETALFTDLREMKDIDEWSFRLGELTPGQEEFLDIWKKMGEVYRTFLSNQHKSGKFSYGTIICNLVQNPSDWIRPSDTVHFIIAGHRLLSNHERNLINMLPSKEIWLDRDILYEDTAFHEASSFIKKSGRGFHYVDQPSEGWLNLPRQIRLHACSTTAAECLRAGQILASLSTTELSETSVIVMDDKWIPVLLEHIPQSSGFPSVAHGYSVMHSDIASLILILTELSAQQSKGITPGYSDLLNLIGHDSLSGLFAKDRKAIQEALIEHQIIRLHRENLNLLESKFASIKTLLPFLGETNTGISLANRLLNLIDIIDAVEERTMQRRLLSIVAEALDESLLWISRNPAGDDPSALHWIFSRMASQKKIPVLADARPGPTILHLSETIHLDFKRVIILGANEGLLPSTRAAGTIIPFEIRRLFGLPLAEEEEQVQAWLFYRLLQRAVQADITYSTAGNSIGQKEISRYLLQLKYEVVYKCPNTVLSSVQFPAKNPILRNAGEYQADHETHKQLDLILTQKGLSASAINTWNTCTLDFYFKYLLNLREPPEIEETMKPSTLGTITHDILLELYEPFIGRFPEEADHTAMLGKVDDLTAKYLDKHYSSAQSASGRDFIASRVIKQMIRDFIESERKQYQKIHISEKPVIVALEHPLETNIHLAGTKNEVKLKGVIDRLELTTKGYRVIDFKTGGVRPDDLKTKSDKSIMSKPKLLQLCLYMLLVRKEVAKNGEPVSAGIFSFVTSRKGLLLAKPYGSSVFPDDVTLQNIESEIGNVVSEMMGATRFSHIKGDYCTYCND